MLSNGILTTIIMTMFHVVDLCRDIFVGILAVLLLDLLSMLFSILSASFLIFLEYFLHYLV